MRLQGKVLIEIQGKTNSGKNGHLYKMCAALRITETVFHTT